MTHLNASHNQISELIDFKAPKCLEVIDLSYNKITYMKELKELRFLEILNLNDNEIDSIEGLKQNKNLKVKFSLNLLSHKTPRSSNSTTTNFS